MANAFRNCKVLFSNCEIKNKNRYSFLWTFFPQECGVQNIATHKVDTIRASNNSCIATIRLVFSKYNQQDAMLLNFCLFLQDVLHVLGGISANHQEH